MQFLYPSFLWALFLISIPIIIHLFHFRRFKNVYFSSIKFLKELKEETSSRSKLRNLLVLLSRILAIIALVLAFAQPYIPKGDDVKKGIKSVSIFIDNSYSMNVIGDEISLIEKAKLDASNIVEAFNNDDRFQIITNEMSFAQQQWLNKENAIERIGEVQSGHKAHTLQQVVNRQQEALRNANTTNPIIFWLSDFQLNMMNFDPGDLDTSMQLNAIRYASVREANISIDSCWWIAPIPVLGQKGSLIVKLNNYGNQDVEGLGLNLLYGGQNFPLGKVDIPAENFAIDTLQFSLNKGGWNDAKLEISDYPVMFDDKYYIAFEVADNLPVLIVSQNQPSKYTKALFDSGTIFNTEYKALTRVDYTGLSKYKLVLMEDVTDISSGLSAVLKEYVSEGGNLMWFPGRLGKIESMNEFIGAMGGNLITGVEQGEFVAGQINENEFVFSGVFEKQKKNISLPAAQERYILQSTSRSKNRQIISFRDGKPFIEAFRQGDGNFYFSAVPLDAKINDLVRHAEIFVPMLYKMGLSSNKIGKLAYTIGKDQLVQVDRVVEGSDVPYRVKGANEFIPSMRNVGSVVQLNLQDQVETEGIYDVIHQDKLVRKMAFNYDRIESDPACMQEDELVKKLGTNGTLYTSSRSALNLKESIIEREKGVILWKWFIILALLFFAIEIALIRFIRV